MLSPRCTEYYREHCTLSPRCTEYYRDYLVK